MDIGTAKPSPELQAALPHHLINVRDPSEQFNAGDFVQLARKACLEIHARGALPVVSGGTGFYLSNLVSGLPETPPTDTGIREALRRELAEAGPEPLLAELASGDPLSAVRIHRNDSYRLLRALEVQRLTGRPLSSFERNVHANIGGEDGNLCFLLYGLERERDALYSRIDARVDAMFEAGLAAEVRGLAERGYTPDDPGLKAIGYREFFVRDAAGDGGSDYWRFDEDTPRNVGGTEISVRGLIARNSRRYAKRQITWFKAVPNVTWLRLDDGQ
jgi:tRNA dimethylallyltransferase